MFVFTRVPLKNIPRTDRVFVYKRNSRVDRCVQKTKIKKRRTSFERADKIASIFARDEQKTSIHTRSENLTITYVTLEQRSSTHSNTRAE